MNIEEIEQKIRREIHKLKRQNIEAKFVIVSYNIFDEITNSKNFIPSFKISLVSL